MAKKTVEFDAHQTVKQPTKVTFKTKAGEKVRFVAEKPTKVPVHVKVHGQEASEVTHLHIDFRPVEGTRLWRRFVTMQTRHSRIQSRL